MRAGFPHEIPSLLLDIHSTGNHERPVAIMRNNEVAALKQLTQHRQPLVASG